MGKKIRTLSLVKNERGQSVVEYILLLAVVVTIASVVFDKFNLGPNSVFFAELRNQMIYSYCNPKPGSDPTCDHDYNTVIESYSSSKLFIPAEVYP